MGKTGVIQNEMCCGFSPRNSKMDHKYRIGWCGLDSSCFGLGQVWALVMNLQFHNCREFLDWWRNCQCQKTVCAPWSYLVSCFRPESPESSWNHSKKMASFNFLMDIFFSVRYAI